VTHRSLVLAALAMVFSALPAAAQQPDYLTPEEVKLVRDTEDPGKRVALFLDFAQGRLALFEKALAPAPSQTPPKIFEMRDLLNSFIRAVDDTSDKLETALARGGVDLRKLHGKINKQCEDFQQRIARAQESPAAASDEDLNFDLEDAGGAGKVLFDLAKTIPDKPIPAIAPAEEETPAEAEKEAPPGQPTLKRRKKK